MENKEMIHTDLAIIGAGMAGMAAALFDFGLYLYLNYQTTRKIGKGVYFYLPKRPEPGQSHCRNQKDVIATRRSLGLLLCLLVKTG